MDRNNRFTAVESLFGAITRLRPQLKTEMQMLARCASLWPQILEHPLSAHTRPLDWRERCILVGADSPVWAHTLRHRRASILASLRAEDVPVEQLTVRVSQHHERTSRPRLERVMPSSTVSQVVETTARGVSDDELRASLLKLAKSLRRQR